jgi:hypothetical protein
MGDEIQPLDRLEWAISTVEWEKTDGADDPGRDDLQRRPCFLWTCRPSRERWRTLDGFEVREERRMDPDVYGDDRRGR